MGQTLGLALLIAVPALAVAFGVLQARTGSYVPVCLMLTVLAVTTVSCFMFPSPKNGPGGTVDFDGLVAITGLLALAAALVVGALAGWISLRATGRDPAPRRRSDFYPDVILTGIATGLLRWIA